MHQQYRLSGNHMIILVPIHKYNLPYVAPLLISFSNCFLCASAAFAIIAFSLATLRSSFLTFLPPFFSSSLPK